MNPGIALLLLAVAGLVLLIELALGFGK